MAAATASAEENKSPDQPIGVIPIDSIFSPVRRVAYAVEQARVGQRTDYDKLTLDIETDGSKEPQEALREAAEILISQLAIFTDADRIEELRAGPGGGSSTAVRASQVPVALAGCPAGASPRRWTTSSSRSSSSGVRSYNCLKRAGIQTVGDLVLEDRGRAQRDPELRQEVDRRGHRDAGGSRARPARLVAKRPPCATRRTATS